MWVSLTYERVLIQSLTRCPLVEPRAVIENKITAKQTHCVHRGENKPRATRRARLSSSTLVGLLTATQPDRRQQLLVCPSAGVELSRSVRASKTINKWLMICAAMLAHVTRKSYAICARYKAICVWLCVYVIYKNNFQFTAIKSETRKKSINILHLIWSKAIKKLT